MRKIVTEEWNSRRLGSWVDPDASFDETMLSTPTNESYDKEWFVLNNIINWYAWLDRNNIIFNGEASPPPSITANKIWFEFESTIRATKNQYLKTFRWWTNRIILGGVDPELAEAMTTALQSEINRITPFIPGNNWISPYEEVNETDEFIPIPFERFSPPMEPSERWRLTTIPPPQRRNHH